MVIAIVIYITILEVLCIFVTAMINYNFLYLTLYLIT
jgi:hypothetical protein